MPPTVLAEMAYKQLVTTYADGSFAVTPLWDVPGGATATYDEYDIVADRYGTGEGTYNAASYGIDSVNMAGIVAPVPELASIATLRDWIGDASGAYDTQKKRLETRSNVDGRLSSAIDFFIFTSSKNFKSNKRR